MLTSLQPAPLKFGEWTVVRLPDHTVILFFICLFACLWKLHTDSHSIDFFYPHQQWKFIFEWSFTMKTEQQELFREFRGIFCHGGWQLVPGPEDECRCISCTKLNWIQHWDLGMGDMNVPFSNLILSETMYCSNHSDHNCDYEFLNCSGSNSDLMEWASIYSARVAGYNIQDIHSFSLYNLPLHQKTLSQHKFQNHVGDSRGQRTGDCICCELPTVPTPTIWETKKSVPSTVPSAMKWPTWFPGSRELLH